MSKNSINFTGTFTALVTPMHIDGSIHYEDLERLVYFQLEHKIQGLVLLGTTGEAATLSLEEQLQIVTCVARWVKQSVPIIVGIHTNSTQVVLDRMEAFINAGADAFLLVTPYYNKPSQAGLFQHFHTIDQACTYPWILYTVPARCGVNIESETYKQLLATCHNLHGIKESTGSCDRVSELLTIQNQSHAVLSGDDSCTFPFMALGAKGCVSVISNYKPSIVVELVQLCLQEKWDKARALHLKYFTLLKHILSIDTNPVPIKHVLHIAGLISTPKVRLPLVNLDLESVAYIKRLINQ